MKRHTYYLLCLFVMLQIPGCGKQTDPVPTPTITATPNPIQAYAAKPDANYQYKLHKTIKGEKHTTHILHMTSGDWLTTAQVEDPTWWHWVHIVVPNNLTSNIGMLFIAGGSRKPNEPKDADALIQAIALNTGSVAIHLHNIPNQPVKFVGDTAKPRKEDALIAYAWRQYLENGATEEHIEWLPRLPMARAAVRAMDAATDYMAKTQNHTLDQYVVAGASKRGWTTWATAIADTRVIAIAPIVIDMLNVVPSFEHHWQAYGNWSPAINNYVDENIMPWMRSTEFKRLLNNVDPYSYRDQLTLPKMMIYASGDEFFLPDSWQFYWQDLTGEKHLRYVPNTGHSLKNTDAIETLIAFHHSIVTNTPRPDFAWRVEDEALFIQADKRFLPESVTLWQATNENARDFRINVIGKKWISKTIPLSENGFYNLRAETPPKGWTAFFAELTYPTVGKYPFKMTTGVVVTPNTLPHAPYNPEEPKGSQQ